MSSKKPAYSIPKGSTDHIIKGNVTTKKFIKSHKKFLHSLDLTPKQASIILTDYYANLREILLSGDHINVYRVGRIYVCKVIVKDKNALIPTYNTYYKIRIFKQGLLQPYLHSFVPSNRLLKAIYKNAQKENSTFDCKPCKQTLTDIREIIAERKARKAERLARKQQKEQNNEESKQ
jgi:hypothetical protein